MAGNVDYSLVGKLSLDSAWTEIEPLLMNAAMSSGSAASEQDFFSRLAPEIRREFKLFMENSVHVLNSRTLGDEPNIAVAICHDAPFIGDQKQGEPVQSYEPSYRLYQFDGRGGVFALDIPRVPDVAFFTHNSKLKKAWQNPEQRTQLLSEQNELAAPQARLQKIIRLMRERDWRYKLYREQGVTSSYDLRPVAKDAALDDLTGPARMQCAAWLMMEAIRGGKGVSGIEDLNPRETQVRIAEAMAPAMHARIKPALNQFRAQLDQETLTLMANLPEEAHRDLYAFLSPVKKTTEKKRKKDRDLPPVQDAAEKPYRHALIETYPFLAAHPNLGDRAQSGRLAQGESFRSAYGTSEERMCLQFLTGTYYGRLQLRHGLDYMSAHPEQSVAEAIEEVDRAIKNKEPVQPALPSSLKALAKLERLQPVLDHLKGKSSREIGAENLASLGALIDPLTRLAARGLPLPETPEDWTNVRRITECAEYLKDLGVLCDDAFEQILDTGADIRSVAEGWDLSEGPRKSSAVNALTDLHFMAGTEMMLVLYDRMERARQLCINDLEEQIAKTRARNVHELKNQLRTNRRGLGDLNPEEIDQFCRPGSIFTRDRRGQRDPMPAHVLRKIRDDGQAARLAQYMLRGVPLEQQLENARRLVAEKASVIKKRKLYALEAAVRNHASEFQWRALPLALNVIYSGEKEEQLLPSELAGKWRFEPLTHWGDILDYAAEVGMRSQLASRHFTERAHYMRLENQDAWKTWALAVFKEAQGDGEPMRLEFIEYAVAEPEIDDDERCEHVKNIATQKLMSVANAYKDWFNGIGASQAPYRDRDYELLERANKKTGFAGRVGHKPGNPRENGQFLKLIASYLGDIDMERNNRGIMENAALVAAVDRIITHFVPAYAQHCGVREIKPAPAEPVRKTPGIYGLPDHNYG